VIVLSVAALLVDSAGVLEMRDACEHCNRKLAPDATDAMICSFECTFCATCVGEVLHGVCPNCGGGFERRPRRAAVASTAG
jgi:hypothetical protein